MTTIRSGLIQMGLKAPTNKSPADIAQTMPDAHVPLIENAGNAGVQISAFRKCSTSLISVRARFQNGMRRPNGPTVGCMQEFAKKHRMVIVVPIYEEAMTGVYYNAAAVIDADGSYLGKSQDAHSPGCGLLGEILLQTRLVGI